MKKRFYFGSNLKMYKNIKETTSYLKELVDLTGDISREDMTLFIIPSFPTLASASSCIDHSLCLLGAQNMHPAEQGQFTGEVSPLMLQEIGTDLVMIGHSERRHVFGETDPEENAKVLSALSHGFRALLCIGETAEEKAYGISREVLRTQLKIGLHNVSTKDLDRIWIAYEPVWSIGVQGTPASPDYAQEMHRAIRKCLIELFGDRAKDIPCLYGGSVNPQNADSLIIQPDIDGLFVGRAAWEAQKFNSLIRQAIHTSETFNSGRV